MSDYDDQMSAVEDGLIDYDDVHCRHGVFIGGWAGPDYLCGWCESGITDAEYAAMRESYTRKGRRLAALSAKLGDLMNVATFMADVTKRHPENREAMQPFMDWIGARIGKLARWGAQLPPYCKGCETFHHGDDD